MRLLIVITVVIIFVSALFILFIYDTVLKDQVDCLAGVKDDCDFAEMSTAFLVGVFMISVFILVDILVIYIVIKSITSKGAVTYIF